MSLGSRSAEVYGRAMMLHPGDAPVYGLGIFVSKHATFLFLCLKAPEGEKESLAVQSGHCHPHPFSKGESWETMTKEVSKIGDPAMRS